MAIRCVNKRPAQRQRAATFPPAAAGRWAGGAHQSTVQLWPPGLPGPSFVYFVSALPGRMCVCGCEGSWGWGQPQEAALELFGEAGRLPQVAGAGPALRSKPTGWCDRPHNSLKTHPSRCARAGCGPACAPQTAPQCLCHPSPCVQRCGAGGRQPTWRRRGTARQRLLGGPGVRWCVVSVQPFKSKRLNTAGTLGFSLSMSIGAQRPQSSVSLSLYKRLAAIRSSQASGLRVHRGLKVYI